jgi:hypothetical protein
VVYNKPVWYDRERDDTGTAVPSAAGINGRGLPPSLTAGSNGIEGCYVPGQTTQDYRIHNAAKLFKAGTDIVFQLHYTPKGKEVNRPTADRLYSTESSPFRLMMAIGKARPRKRSLQKMSSSSPCFRTCTSAARR